jgi:GT2 family glycosyltransferase
MRELAVLLFRKFLSAKKLYGYKGALKRVFWFLKTRRITSKIQSSKNTLKSFLGKKFFRFETHHSTNILSLVNASTLNHDCTSDCDSSSPPALSIVVPTIGKSEVLLQCLQTIASSAQKIHLRFEVILAIDSNTSLEARNFIKKVINEFGCRSLRILEHSTFTSGFSHQVNAGVEIARGTDILILNDDTISEPNLLEELFSVSWRTNNMILSPLILNLDKTIQECGSVVNLSGACEWIGSGQQISWIEHLNSLKVDFASAVCWLMNRSKFQDTGGLTSFSGMNYYEDVRFAVDPKNELETHVITSAQIMHCLSRSSDHSEKMLVVNEVTRHLFRDWWKKQEKRNTKKLKIMALYLPQFYATEYNDLWWGTGYTEWSALANWEQQINENPERLLPSELGFYNLMNQSVIERQSSLANNYGVDAFAVMTYWFNGTKLLEKPLENFLCANLSTDFCLFWANESWSRKWDGHEDELLIKQTHDSEDSKAFIRAHKDYLAHARYVQIQGKKVIYIYRRELFENVSENLDAMRSEARRLGVGELFIVAFESFEQSFKREDPTKQGFDAAAEYPPHGKFPAAKFSNFGESKFKGRSHDFRDIQNDYLSRNVPSYPLIRGVLVGFDNTSRLKSRSTIFQNSSVSNFQNWLYLASKNALSFGDSTDNWVILNAWNEWSESAVLEPSVKSGRDYLAGVKIVKDSMNELEIDIRHE